MRNNINNSHCLYLMIRCCLAEKVTAEEQEAVGQWIATLDGSGKSVELIKEIERLRTGFVDFVEFLEPEKGAFNARTRRIASKRTSVNKGKLF